MIHDEARPLFDEFRSGTDEKTITMNMVDGHYYIPEYESVYRLLFDISTHGSDKLCVESMFIM